MDRVGWIVFKTKVKIWVVLGVSVREWVGVRTGKRVMIRVVVGVVGDKD